MDVWEYSGQYQDGMVFYCEMCATEYRLRLRFGGFAAGYCELCGVAGSLIGYDIPEELIKKDIKIPNLEEFLQLVERKVENDTA